MERKKIVIENSNEKKSSKVGKFFYNLFVNNAGYKLVALGVAILIWVLVAGL